MKAVAEQKKDNSIFEYALISGITTLGGIAAVAWYTLNCLSLLS